MAYHPVAHGEQNNLQQTRITRDHGEIRRWIEQRGGRPARVRGNLDPDEVGLLRIEMPGQSLDQPLEPIGWDEFFRTFEQQKVALLYRYHKQQPDPADFHKLVHRANLYTPD
jgi:hypothetical protein